jgi:hypothetical protein
MRPRCVDCVIVGIVAAACRCINHHLNIEIPNVFVRRIFASHLFCSDSPQPRTCSPRPLVRNHAHALMADSFPRLAPTVCVAFNKRRDTPSHLPSPCAATCGSADNRFDHGCLPSRTNSIAFLPSPTPALGCFMGVACQSDCCLIHASAKSDLCNSIIDVAACDVPRLLWQYGHLCVQMCGNMDDYLCAMTQSNVSSVFAIHRNGIEAFSTAAAATIAPAHAA